MKKRISFLHRALGTTLFTGFSPYFPGTLSSVLILLFYPLIEQLNLFIFMGIALCATAYLFYSVPFFEEEYGKDPSCYTMDESIATFILIFVIQRTGLNLWVGFISWRLLDIFKPFFIGKLQQLKGGWGVLADDLAAAAGASFTAYLFSIIPAI